MSTTEQLKSFSMVGLGGSAVDDQLDELIGQVKSALVEEPSLRALFLSGSRVTGIATPASDFDFTVLTDTHQGIDALLVKLQRSFEFLGYRHEVPHFKHSQALLAVCIYPLSVVKEIVTGAFTSADYLMQWQGFLQHKVLNARALYDPDGLLDGFQTHLDGYPEQVAREIAIRALDYIEAEYIQEWNFRSPYHFAYSLKEILERIGLALYALNRRFYSPPLKELHRELAQMRPNIEDPLSRLVTLTPDVNLAEKQRLLAAIVNEMRDSLNRQQLPPTRP